MSELNIDYNSDRTDLIIPEYGRNIQRMVEYAVSVKSRELRNQVALAIINVMGQLFPHLRDVDDYKHKLWDHIFIMSDFKLDVDSPYPVPNAQQFQEKPEIISYSKNNIKYGHYGTIIGEVLKKAVDFPEGEDKDRLVVDLGNMLKRMYLIGSQSSANDEVIKRQVVELSGGKLVWKDEWTLAPSNELAPPQKQVQHSRKRKKPQKKRRKY
ncbi:MAG: DUF4290 domain-containing protein [Bacteroidetes bacterium]|nr:MAG: DUF4290 domain-containing protein [Bacteroidota bacterium]